jgi:hypothetical protein
MKVKSFNDAVRRALNLFPYHSRWANLQKAGMAVDFSWRSSAEKYLALYKKLIEESKAPVLRELYPQPKEIKGRRIREAKEKLESTNGDAA